MKVLLVDKNSLFLEGLQNLLQSCGVEVSSTAISPDEVLTRTRIFKPDVIILNIIENRDDRFEIIRTVKTEKPSIRVIAFADCQEKLRGVKEYGARVYLLSDINVSELMRELDVK